MLLWETFVNSGIIYEYIVDTIVGKNFLQLINKKKHNLLRILGMRVKSTKTVLFSLDISLYFHFYKQEVFKHM